ncbi:MAG: IMP cyclohydrolase [Deltaproteobacteria bacterium]|nr:IMP cyclohydrolase [Deltaproteobacteria bacterium]
MSEIRQMYRTVMDDHFPPTLTIRFGDQTLEYRKRAWKLPDDAGDLVEKGLRYGENPGQEAALYELVGGNLTLGGCTFLESGNGLVAALAEEHMLQAGKHPGKTNLTDVDNGLNILKYLMDSPTAVILKHNNPCGAAQAASLDDAYARANRADRVAAFGGALVVNRALDRTTAEAVAANYLEVVAAPDYEEGAVDLLKRRRDLRILAVPRMDRLAAYRARRTVEFKALMDGGLIVQQSPLNTVNRAEDFRPAVAVKDGVEHRVLRPPTPSEVADLLFGWCVEQGVTSNSVLYVKDRCTVGIGTGEQDRVGVAEIAVFKAYTKHADALCFDRWGLPMKDLELQVARGQADRARLEELRAETARLKGGLIGSSMISDAFFPFRDGVDVGLREGVSAVCQAGGSNRDWEVIDAINEAGATMVFTGQRCFKH